MEHIFAGLDVLVNNAGYADNGHTLATTPDEIPQRMFTVNVFAPMALTREALPHIRKFKGNVIFISSVAGRNECF